MGFRFRKSISIIPGVRINLSNGAPSLSVGPRGASLSFGKRGTYANLGLPGTGLSYRTRIDRTVRERQNNRVQANPGLREELEQEVESLMSAITAISSIHELSPSPVGGNTWASLESYYFELHQRTFDRPAPVRPAKPVFSPLPSVPDERCGRGFLGGWFETDAARTERQNENQRQWQQQVADVERENTLLKQRYEKQRVAWAEQYANWQYEAQEHEKNSSITADVARKQFRSDARFFEDCLAEMLSQTEWPRETLVTFEVRPDESMVWLDVDLPEIEDMPDKVYVVNAKGTDITEKTMTQKAVRESYARHVHGCLMRLAAIVFQTLPFEHAVISGFTQRISKQTGYLEDEYILSCRIDRHHMEKINYTNLKDVDPIAVLSVQALVRKMSATFLFQAIDPIMITAGTS
ncbi:TPA: DUF4236 domain-containing protein [Raoultella ornithinolytica]|nr:DUF4236 domain-containing protein [Raoultella ornithinolytica]